MKKEELMKKYQSGDLEAGDQDLLESYIEQGIIDIEELEDLDKIRSRLSISAKEIPTSRMRDRFNEMLIQEKYKASRLNLWDRIWSAMAIDLPSVQYYRLAYSIGILLVGLAVGWLLRPTGKYQDQLADINSEVHQMKEMMMISMLKEPSATERLKAVSMSSELPASYGRVVDALFNTLNNDDNVNVRLAALEALGSYTDDPAVRAKLIASIGNQDSPLVQVEMAELMVLIQEKGSVEELQKLIDKESTDTLIKKQLTESIGQLI